VLIDWSDEFERMYSDLENRASVDPEARRVFALLQSELKTLQDLQTQPVEDLPSLKRVRQSRKHEVWRVSHPYRPGHAVRTIVWFPDARHVVIALFANDKAQMGDVFYDSVGTRADQVIENHLRRIEGERR